MFVLAALGIGAGVAFLVAWIVTGIIEERTRESIRLAYAAAGLDWAEIDTDGMQVRIGGTAPDAEARERAAEIAGRLVSPSRIVTAIILAPPPPEEVAMPPPGLEILRTGQAVTLTGVIPGAATRQQIDTALAGLEVTDHGEVAAGAELPESWARLLPLALTAMQALPRSQIRLEECGLWVSGAAPSQTERDRIRAMLSRPGPCPVSHDILAPRPLVSPYRFELGLAEHAAVLPACTARDESDIARIRAALEGLEIAGGISCVEALGAPSAAWPEAVLAAIATLRELGTGRVALSDTEIRLRVPASVDETSFTAAGEALRRALPEGFSLRSERSSGEEEDYALDRAVGLGARFRAVLPAEGGVQLSGPLRHDAARQAVASYAASLFGTGGLVNRTVTDRTLPDGWTARVMAGLDALALMHAGKLEVGETRIALTGSSTDPGAEAQVRRILGQVAGVGTELALSISYDAKAAAEEAAPSPEACLTEIRTILAKDQIVFASSSARIEGESAQVLDDIAEVMRRCVTSSFEIAGYTDNSGRAEKNLQLSAQRAEAVVDALLSRGVDLDRMIAKGYGEANPIADNETEEGRAANRRIEVRLVQPRAKPEATTTGPEPPADTPPPAEALTGTDDTATPADPATGTATVPPEEAPPRGPATPEATIEPRSTTEDGPVDTLPGRSDTLAHASPPAAPAVPGEETPPAGPPVALAPKTDDTARPAAPPPRPETATDAQPRPRPRP
ncbi:MAG: OmpA family protein, partial [Alphaproteobacteria bacterium]